MAARTHRPPRHTTEPEVRSQRFVALARAADYLDVAPYTVRQYISDGKLTGYRLAGGHVRVDMNEVEALLKPIPTVGTIHEPAS